MEQIEGIIGLLSLVGAVVLIICYIIVIYKLRKDYKWAKKFSSLKHENAALNMQNTAKRMEYLSLKDKVTECQQQLEISSQNIENSISLEKQVKESCEKNIQDLQDSLEENCNIIRANYAAKEEEIRHNFEIEQSNYEVEKEKLHKEISQLQQAWKTLQQAAIDKEKEQEKQDFYRLKLSDDDLSDVLLFEEFKTKVKNKRAVSMLIWSTWFQKPMTTLCTKVLGAKPICGIYKITNINNSRCYVGQSLNTADRWKTHAKHGLGIDTPANNKLYNAMQKEGIWNFTWELLEECAAADLNERERYYIDLYLAKDYGYNGNAGIKKEKV